MDITLLNKFMRLASALSPENLHCDGEISRTAAEFKRRQLNRQWRALEAEFGRKVTEDEVWSLFLTTHRGAPAGEKVVL